MRFSTTGAFLALLPWFSCSGGGGTSPEVSAVSSLPAVDSPIGPVPGPGQAAVPPHNPYAKDAVATAEGRKLFDRFNCSGCHGGHAGGGMGPSLRDPDWLYGDEDAQIFSSIALGRGKGMPAWGTRLPRSEIWKLTAYVPSLRTDREPDPPR